MIDYNVAMISVQEVLQFNTGRKVEFAPTDRLEDLGLDSLDLVEISIDLEDTFMFEAGDGLRWVKTVDDLVKLVVSKGRSAP